MKSEMSPYGNALFVKSDSYRLLKWLGIFILDIFSDQERSHGADGAFASPKMTPKIVFYKIKETIALLFLGIICLNTFSVNGN